MIRVAAWVVTLSGVVGLGEAWAQGVSVEHKPVDCIVAGEYAKLDACFTPAATVARARLYFKLTSSATWYYVDMKTQSPCWSGALPKPKKALIQQKLQYYVQVLDKSTAEGRSPEYSPTIVGSESECGKDKLVAPLSAAGPAAIFPAAPAGFVTGLGATPFVLGGLGVAAVGGTALVLAKDDSNPVDTPVATPPSTPPPPVTPPPVQPLPPDPKLELDCKAEPASGSAPLSVKFFAYPAGGTGVYDYVWNFGNGSGSNEKNPTYVYGSSGTFPVLLTVTSGSQTATCSRTVAVDGKGNRVTATWYIESDLGTVVSVPAGISCTNTVGVPTSCSAVFATGTSVTLTTTCANRIFAPVYRSGCDSVSANSCTVLANADRAVEVSCDAVLAVASTEGLAWIRTSLEAGGARGRVIMDGVGMVPVASDGPRQVDFRPRGTHRVEAVVDAARAGGLWKFDLADAGVADGTLRVLSGGVVQVSPGSVVFRISGQVGERIAFTFITTRRGEPKDAPRER